MSHPEVAHAGASSAPTPAKRALSPFALALIWFGAAVSIAEILTGTAFAPLGFARGMQAIVLGHLIGCALFFAAGLMGAKTGRGAMQTVKLSFGERGSYLFSVLNVVQLIGWTSIMIYNGALAANTLVDLGGPWIWDIVIGGLIVVWILIGIKNIQKINVVAMAALFALTVVMSATVFSGHVAPATLEPMAFGAAVELGVAMPLSWLPLVSDYTREADKPVAASLVATVTYFFGSCWMYAIGLGAALFTGENDIALVMLKAGLGIAGLLIVIFSTVTTTFLDAYSAGVSTTAITPRAKTVPVAVAIAIVGTALAIFAPVQNLEGFLYFIGSVFAPMIAIMIVDFFILKTDRSGAAFALPQLAVWLIGFALYRFSLTVDPLFCGNTLPVMLVTGVLAYLAGRLVQTCRA